MSYRDAALIDRRHFLAATAATIPLGGTCGAESAGNLQLATFRYDVTPPLGHSLCGGWIKPVVAVDDPLEAIGFVLLGAGQPIVVCVVDWCGILNSAHLQWRQALAEAAGTSVDRVTVHCVHQHNAPFACLTTQDILAAQGDLPPTIQVDFFQRCLDAGRQAVAQAVQRSSPVTHIAAGQARVDGVASNRRIIGLDGRVASQRGSSSKNPLHHRLPDGLIDPMLKTVAFYHQDQPLAACHYYACHPMSYYGDGRVSSDFCGLARRARQQADAGCTHLYFNGCGGNIGAGKYNDGSAQQRGVLTQRILAGIESSERELRPEPIESVTWNTTDLLPPTHPRFDEQALLAQISDRSRSGAARSRPAFTLAWMQRVQSGLPITLAGLHVNQVSMLHLPSECFVEYQLRAQAAAGDRFVVCPAYGDGGPWYIPVAAAYPQGGYAVDVAWCDPQIDPLLSAGIGELLQLPR